MEKFKIRNRWSVMNLIQVLQRTECPYLSRAQRRSLATCLHLPYAVCKITIYVAGKEFSLYVNIL
jgi:hypothetical protein